MADLNELASLLFGSRRAEADTARPTVSVAYGVATAVSEDGTVAVWIGDDTVSPSDAYAEWESIDSHGQGAWDGMGASTSVEMPTEVRCVEGDVVRIQLVGSGAGKRPTVVGVVGRGDEQDGRIHAIEADYVRATELDADVARIGYLKADSAVITDLQADTAKVHDLTADELTASTAYIADLTAGNVRAADLVADHAEVSELDAHYAHIDLANIEDACIKTAMIGDAAITNAKIGQAAIGTANIQEAAVTHALIADGAVGNAQILDVSANKITTGTIDASRINVANLNADNLVVRRINGQPVIGGWAMVSTSSSGYDVRDPSQQGWYEYVDGAFVASADTSVEVGKSYYVRDGEEVELYDRPYIDDAISSAMDRVDSRLSTYSGDAVPTLANWPYTEWASGHYDFSLVTSDGDALVTDSGDGLIVSVDSRQSVQEVLASHVGDVYFVDNPALGEHGYCYRFAWVGDSYAWVLVKDSDLTQALAWLGDMDDVSGSYTVASFITHTDAELTSTQTEVSTLRGDLGSHESFVTNTVSQQLHENSSVITNLTTRLQTNPDGTASEEDVVSRQSAIRQDVDSISASVSSLSETVSGTSRRLAQAETAILMNTEAIALRATKSEVDEVGTKADSAYDAARALRYEHAFERVYDSQEQKWRYDFTARLWRGDEDVTSDEVPERLVWWLRNEGGDALVARGTTWSVYEDDVRLGYRPSVIGGLEDAGESFDARLVDSGGDGLVTSDGDRLVMHMVWGD